MTTIMPIVNERDEIIGFKNRDEITKNDVYRISALRITNSKGEALLAQRAYSKKRHPGYRWPAVAGSVEKWESYKENIIKEAFEELWIENQEFKESIKKYSVWTTGHKHFTQWYTIVLDRETSDFTPAMEEVEKIGRFSKDDFQKQLGSKTEKFLSSMDWCFSNL